MDWTAHELGRGVIAESAVVGFAEANCYLFGCAETKLGVVIDPGTMDSDEGRAIVKRVGELGLSVSAILNTHGHPDHMSGNDFLREALDCEVVIHHLDGLKLTDPDRNGSRLFGFDVRMRPADRFIEDGDTIDVGNVALGVLHTPGHSSGGVAFLGDGFVFTGDTLFAGGVGRTDLPCSSEGNVLAWDVLMSSIREKLLTLPDDTIVLPGHGPATTIGAERSGNPHLR